MAVDEMTRWRADQARGYMEHVRSISISMECRREEIERMRSKQLPAAVVCTEGTQGSVYGDAVPDGIIALDEAICAYCSDLVGFVDEMKRAHDAISRVDCVERREILRLRYLCGMSLREASERMRYEYQSSKRLCMLALADVWEFIPLEWRDRVPRAI